MTTAFQTAVEGLPTSNPCGSSSRTKEMPTVEKTDDSINSISFMVAAEHHLSLRDAIAREHLCFLDGISKPLSKELAPPIAGPDQARI